MADTLCGPANPLHSFQKHTQVDRSLQSDRLVPRQRPGGSGFRTQDPAESGLLDPEFEAFQAGQLPPTPQFPAQTPLNALEPLGRPQPSFTHQTPASGGWAADFAKLQITPHPPPPQAHAQVADPSAWHQDFQNSLRQTRAPSALEAPQVHPFRNVSKQMPFTGIQQPMGYVSSMQSPQPSTETRWKGKGRWQPEESAQDMAAFEKEFAALANESILEQRNLAEDVDKLQEMEIGHDIDLRSEELSESARRSLSQMNKEQDAINQATQNVQDQEEHSGMERRLGANGILPLNETAFETRRDIPSVGNMTPEENDMQGPDVPNVDEDLAREAGQLLDAVADDQSEKFRNSSFLSLMREFRDHEKSVQGNEVVDVDQTVNAPPKASTPQQDADLGRLPPMEPTMTGAIPSKTQPYRAHVDEVADQMGKSSVLSS